MRHLLIAFLAALLATTAQAQVIPGPRPGGGLSAQQVTNIAQTVANNINQQALSYYWRTNLSATISGYYHMARLTDFTPSATNNFITVNSVTNNHYVFSFVSQPTNGVGVIALNPGSYHIDFSAFRSNPGSVTMQSELYVRNQAGNESEIGNSATSTLTTSLAAYSQYITITTNVFLNSSDRLVAKLKVITQTSNPNVTIAVENGAASRIDVPVPSSAFVLATSLSNNTVNAQSIFAPNTYVPAGNLTNAWRIWSITTNYTSASQLSLTLPSALIVRYTLLIPTNGYASGLALACTINGNTQSIYNAAGTKTDTSSAYASKTNIFWPVTASTFTSPTYPSHATITFTPGNASSGWGGVHYSSVFFAGDIRDGYPSRHVVDGSSLTYQSVTNANIFWVSGATNHWFMSNAVVITEVLQ